MKNKIVKAYKADMDGFYSNIVIVEIEKDMMTQYKKNYMEMKALKSFK